MQLVISERLRRQAFGEPCTIKRKSVEIQPGVVESVNAHCVDAFIALGTILLSHGYTLRDRDTGSYNCRHIGNDPNRPWSAHAWATAIDVNWSTNPDGRRLVTDMPQAAIDEIVALKTNSGWPVFRWGGDWDRDPRTAHRYYDAMHFEVVCPPAELATGLDFVLPEVNGDPMLGLQDGDVGEGVEALQHLLLGMGYDLPVYGADGDFGGETENAVRALQDANAIPVTGRIDPRTYALLLTPEVGMRGPAGPPGKDGKDGAPGKDGADGTLIIRGTHTLG